MHHDERIEAFYTSKAWRKCRGVFLRECGGLCQICMSNGLIEPATQVHHRIPITPENLDDPRITLSHDNLMALCDSCHDDQHHNKRWRCEPNGHIRL